MAYSLGNAPKMGRMPADERSQVDAGGGEDDDPLPDDHHLRDRWHIAAAVPAVAVTTVSVEGGFGGRMAGGDSPLLLLPAHAVADRGHDDGGTVGGDNVLTSTAHLLRKTC